MPKAVWKGTVIAESDSTEVVDGNHYFPADSVNSEYLSKSDTRSVCPWIGTANYYHIHVDGDVNTDAAWCYFDPKEGVRAIKGRIAFWKGVEVEE